MGGIGNEVVGTGATTVVGIVAGSATDSIVDDNVGGGWIVAAVCEGVVPRTVIVVVGTVVVVVVSDSPSASDGRGETPD